jgi:hypothetical protein
MDPEPLESIDAADAHLGRRVPLPTAPVPLVRWVDVTATGPGAVEVAWNLDDSRPGAPGRLALYAGLVPAPDRGLQDAPRLGAYAHRTLALEEAQPSLRPVHELAWERDGLHLRLTGQGPWELMALVALADSTG